MEPMVKDSYKSLIDHIELCGNIVDIRIMIELFDANIGIGYWFDASKTEEDFDWAFELFKLQIKTGYGFTYFKTNIRKFPQIITVQFIHLNKSDGQLSITKCIRSNDGL